MSIIRLWIRIYQVFACEDEMKQSGEWGMNGRECAGLSGSPPAA